jgi:eukaryotic-like serine/threonine-protein kinase
MTELVGQMVAHYRILEKVGEGGMGVVYKARDTHLGRFVAVKALPAEKVADASRKLRFVQEAKSASALNHPGIVTIHDIVSEDGRDFIVMEYIEGRTLDKAIGRKGLRLNEVLEYGVQIAAALAKAHAAGIVHRDLKPANIMITGDGIVKLLDFGLAKLTEPAQCDESASTRTLDTHTAEGTIVGTAAYLSPEQVEGKTADARSDIFALGSVLYEMVTGRPAFHGGTRMATLLAIVHEQPAPFDGAAPPELEKVILRCLRKDVARRTQHADDLRLALEELKQETASRSPEPMANPQPARRRLRVAALGVVVVVASLLGTLWTRRQTRPPPWQPRFTRVTNQPGEELFPSLSADGRSVTFAAKRSDKWDIYVQRVGGDLPLNLTGDSVGDNTQPAFSPDGEGIAFRSERSGGGLYIMGGTGENLRRLTDFGYNPSWSPDGREIVCATEGVTHPEARMTTLSQLWRVNVGSGEKSLLYEGDAVQPSWSPHGWRVAFWAVRGGQRDILTIAAGGGEAVPITNDTAVDWNPVWSAEGDAIYFASDRSGIMSIWRVWIDEKTGKVRGAPEPFASPSTESGQLSVSRMGRRMVYVNRSVTMNLYKAGFDAGSGRLTGQPAAITRGSRQDSAPSPSPDGGSIVFATLGTQEDLFVIETDGTHLRQLTNDIHKDRSPCWSSDGKRIAFLSNRGGKYEIWTINSDGSGLEQITQTKETVGMGVWSPDGDRIAYPSTDGRIYIRPLQPPGTPQPLPKRSGDQAMSVSSWSRDGQKLAGTCRRADGSPAGIGVYDFGTQSYVALTDFGGSPVWLHDSRNLLFYQLGRVYTIDSLTRKVQQVYSGASNEQVRGIALSPDNRFIYYGLAVNEADIWMLTLP